MELILDYMDPLILDSIYESAEHMAHSICIAGKDQQRSMLATISQGSKRELCSLAMDTDLWSRHSLTRQSISIFVITWSLSSFFYLFFGAFCYYRNFDQSLKRHTKFRVNQIRSEMADSLLALLGLNVLTVPIFVAQARGFSKIYKFGSGSLWYEIAQYPCFILFSDTGMYWLHRAFHCPFLFKMWHSKHHQYVIPTPFSAYAFNPLEAWIMSLPIYAYSFIWPMSDIGQLIVFIFTNIWTFLLHDNRDQFHTVHHKSINFNYGQFLALWDVLAGTYIDPGTFFRPAMNKQ